MRPGEERPQNRGEGGLRGASAGAETWGHSKRLERPGCDDRKGLGAGRDRAGDARAEGRAGQVSFV